jgi:hypothetical protein
MGAATRCRSKHRAGAPTFDFQIRITLARELDQFHIGATGVKGPPSDFKAAG